MTHVQRQGYPPLLLMHERSDPLLYIQFKNFPRYLETAAQPSSDVTSQTLEPETRELMWNIHVDIVTAKYYTSVCSHGCFKAWYCFVLFFSLPLYKLGKLFIGNVLATLV